MWHQVSPYFCAIGISSAVVSFRRGVHRVLLAKTEGKRQLGRPRRRWYDNIKMDLQVAECEAMDWIQLAQDRERWTRYL